MFTILYKSEYGVETLEGDAVMVQKSITPANKEQVHVSFKDGRMEAYEAADGNGVTSSSPRELIVMNENGKTVARWVL